MKKKKKSPPDNGGFFVLNIYSGTIIAIGDQFQNQV